MKLRFSKEEENAAYEVANILNSCSTKEEYIIWCNLHNVDPKKYFSRYALILDTFYISFGLQDPTFSYQDFYKFETIPGAARPNALNILKRFI